MHQPCGNIENKASAADVSNHIIGIVTYIV